MLSARVTDPIVWTNIARSAEWSWRPLMANMGTELAHAASAGSDANEAIAKFLSAAATSIDIPSSPPAWLERIAARLYQEPAVSIAHLAASEGVHRVYLARAFRRHFGLSPRQFRLRAKLSRSIGSSLLLRSLACATAQASGFADESHMLRTIKQTTGFTLRELRTWLGEFTD
jgi:AraC family transcriptional regulator